MKTHRNQKTEIKTKVEEGGKGRVIKNQTEKGGKA
jgi:hypothetical protein